MSVPILDDAYMQRRASLQRMESTVRYWNAYAGIKSANYGLSRDPLEEAKEQYVAGEINAEALETRVEHALRRRPQGLTG